MSLAISLGWLRKHSTSNVQLRHEWGVKIDVENTTLTAGRFVGWMAVQSSRKTSNQATTRRPGYSPHGLTKKRRKSKREIVIRPFQRASQFIRIISSLFPFAISIWHVPSYSHQLPRQAGSRSVITSLVADHLPERYVLSWVRVEENQYMLCFLSIIN